MEKWIVRSKSFGRDGSIVEGLDRTDDGGMVVPGEPFAVVHEKSRVVVYYREIISHGDTENTEEVSG